MVGQAVAAAVAPVVVQSATDDEGLLNKAFKVVMIAAILGVGLLVIYAVSLLAGIVDLGEQTILQAGLSLLGLGGTLGGPFTLFGAGITALGSLAIRR